MKNGLALQGKKVMSRRENVLGSIHVAAVYRAGGNPLLRHIRCHQANRRDFAHERSAKPLAACAVAVLRNQLVIALDDDFPCA